MAYHKFANPKEIEVRTEPFEVSVGLDRTTLRDNRPDLNGYRIRHPNGTVYLILDGTRRHIPNPDTYNNLFRDWSGIIIDIDIDDVNQGSALTIGAVLARPINGSSVYLVSNGVKRQYPCGKSA
jgi:hypothetical protein